jgi:hypothetical protein
MKQLSLPIVKKAYKVWHEGMLSENPYEGYTINDIPIVYATKHSEAKTKATEPYDYDFEGKKPTYINLKSRRAKGADIIFYDNREMRRHQVTAMIERIKRVKERTEAVNKFPDDATFFVQNGYCGNSILWWGKGNGGYISDLNNAQEYTKAEILANFVNGRDEDRIWEASHVRAHIKIHVDAQYLSQEYEA